LGERTFSQNAHGNHSLKDNWPAKFAAWTRQGIVNHKSVEGYVISSGHHQEQLNYGKNPVMIKIVAPVAVYSNIQIVRVRVSI
jgi:hypothetical protein